jgi:hypothetical protein
MRRATCSRRRQKGYALLILAAIFVVGGTWYMLTRLNAQASLAPRQRDHNARVLNEAKQALIGYVAMRAEKAGEQDPGALPCPEASGNYNDPSNEGTAAANCTLPAAGRLPWRTLGLDKLSDAAGEPLWYVVSPGWAKPNSTTNTIINSNTRGQLTVDGAANDSVALIIAPGAPMVAAAATGCAAAQQVRTSASINVANYLECDNATPADGNLVTTGPSGSFNDQVIRLTTRDLLPPIEAAISKRIEREIVPALKSVYASTTWGTNVSASNPIYPFPAPFADPAATTSFQGSAASCSSNVCQGLFPAVFSNVPGTTTLCTSSTGSPCDSNFVRWTDGTIQVQSVLISGTTYFPDGVVWTSPPYACTVVTSGPPQTTRLDCIARVPAFAGILSGDVYIEVKGNASNVGMALRGFDPALSIPNVTITTAPTVALNAAGTGAVMFRGMTQVPPGVGSVVSAGLCGISLGFLPGLECRYVTISVPLSFFPDHALLNTNTSSSTGWFMRNEWYRVLYYAVAQGATPSPLPAAADCTPGTNCITLNTANDKRAVLLLAGRSLTGTAGHTRAFTDFLDSAENRDGNAVFATLSAGASFNDRAIVVQND